MRYLKRSNRIELTIKDINEIFFGITKGQNNKMIIEVFEYMAEEFGIEDCIDKGIVIPKNKYNGRIPKEYEEFNSLLQVMRSNVGKKGFFPYVA